MRHRTNAQGVPVYSGLCPTALRAYPLTLSGFTFRGFATARVDGSLRDCIHPPPFGVRSCGFAHSLHSLRPTAASRAVGAKPLSNKLRAAEGAVDDFHDVSAWFAVFYSLQLLTHEGLAVVIVAPPLVEGADHARC